MPRDQSLRGPLFRLALIGFGCTLLLAFLVGNLFRLVGLVLTPVFIAIIRVATSLGVTVPPLNGAGEVATPFGQVVILAATVAEFGSLVLLTVLFSSIEVSRPTTLVFLAWCVALAVWRHGSLAPASCRPLDPLATIRNRDDGVAAFASIGTAPAPRIQL